ncbi:MAG TPA: hypothetical protein VGE52_09280, partial [Pirellulales bacterium]
TGRGEIVLGKEGDDDFALRLPIVDATPAVAGLIGRPVWNDGFNLYLGRSAVARAVSGVLHFASADAIREAITADRLAVLRSRYDAAVAEAVAAYGAAWTGSPGKFHAANAEFRTRLAECDQLKAEIERLEAAETRAERP